MRLLAGLLAAAATAPGPPPRFLFELEDGSALSGTLVGPVRVRGPGEAEAIPAGEIREIQFGSRADPDREARIQALVGQLGDDDFERREAAQAELVRLGPWALAVLDRAAGDADPEIAARAAEIRRGLVEAGVRPEPGEDRIVLAHGPVAGRVADPALRADAAGRPRELPAALLRAVRWNRSEASVSWFTVRPARESGRAIPSPPYAPGEVLRADTFGSVFAGGAGTWLDPEPGPSGFDLPVHPPAHPANAGAFYSRIERRRGSPPKPLPARPVPAAIRRLAAEDFGSRAVRIDFDRRPDGTALEAGVNLADVYGPLGVTIRAAGGGSYVGTDAYEVGGPSRGLSAATADPRWQGGIEFEFSAEGAGGRRRGVSRVGLCASEVSPGGAGIRAFASDGRPLAEIRAAAQGTDFLAVESSVPISRLVSFPDPASNPNLAVDDLIFEWADDAPVSDELSLRDGSRLAGEALSADAGGIRFRWACAPGGEEFPAAGIDRLVLRGSSPAEAGAAAWRVFLPGGGSLAAARVRLGPALVEVETTWKERLAIPREAVSVLRRLGGAPLPRAPDRPVRGAGRARLRDGRVLEGRPESFDSGESLSLAESSGARREVPAEEIAEVLLGDRPEPREEPRILLTCRDGTFLPGSMESLARAAARVRTAAGTIEIPRSAIRRIDWPR